jgi:hypothetical protein
LRCLWFLDHEIDELHDLIDDHKQESAASREEQQRSVAIRLEAIANRQTRLTDMYIDGAIDKQMFQDRKYGLMAERKALEERQTLLAQGTTSETARLHSTVELLKALRLSHELNDQDGKREFLETTVSNFVLDQKDLVFKLHSPFQELSEMASITDGDPSRGTPRTRAAAIFDLLLEHCSPHGDERLQDDLPLAA